MKARFCPKCGSTELILIAGGELGLMECKKCGFRSEIFPEKEIKLTKKKKSK